MQRAGRHGNERPLSKTVWRTGGPLKRFVCRSEARKCNYSRYHRRTAPPPVHVLMATRDESALSPRSVLCELFAGSAVATTSEALERAAAKARDMGFVVLLLGLQPPSDASELAKFHAAIALQCARHGNPMAPTAMISAGPLLAKTGPATHAEFLLALALALDGHRAIYAYACGPDAMNDTSTGLGVHMGPDTLARAQQLRIDVPGRVNANAARSVFELLGDCEKLPHAPAQASMLRAILITQQ